MIRILYIYIYDLCYILYKTYVFFKRNFKNQNNDMSKLASEPHVLLQDAQAQDKLLHIQRPHFSTWGRTHRSRVLSDGWVRQ